MSEIRDDLKAFVDGELSPERVAEVQAALESDPLLAEEVNDMKQISSILKGLAAPEPLPAGAEKALPKPKPKLGWRVWVPSMALLAVMIVVARPLLSRTTAPVFSGSESAVSADGGIAPSSPLPTEAGESDSGRTRADSFADMNGMKGKMEDPSLPKMKGRTGQGLPAPGSAAPSEGLIGQRLIRTADISLRVASADEAMARATQIATSLRGFAQNSSSQGGNDGQATASVTLRVPVSQFESALARVRGLGEKLSESTNSEDVTAQVADVAARLRVLRAEEDSTITMLRAARKVGEMLEVRERLSMLREEIESLDSQRKALADQTTFSTISCTFVEKVRVGQPEPPKDWAGSAWAESVNAVREVGRAIGAAIIAVFVFSPIWLPPVLLAWWLIRRARR